MSAALDAQTPDAALSGSTKSRPADALRRRTLLVAPVLVLASEYVAFHSLTNVVGPRLGYFLAFAIYWFGWCLLFPAWVLGWRGIHAMFGLAQPRFGRPAWLGVAVLAAPLALGYGLAFPGALRQATPVIVVASFLLAAVNATGEEILWRGVYLRVFPSRAWWGLIWPSLGFAVWHFAPQSMRANTMPGGAWSFVLVAGLFGLGWSWLAQQSGSIRWTAPAHILFDFAGLGALIYMGPNALAVQ
jgi:membrane protease YdiL (CAAX protease family)